MPDDPRERKLEDDWEEWLMKSAGNVDGNVCSVLEAAGEHRGCEVETEDDDNGNGDNECSEAARSVHQVAPALLFLHINTTLSLHARYFHLCRRHAAIT